MNHTEPTAKSPAAKTGFFATLRAASLRANGSGAPSPRRTSFTLASLLAFAAFLAIGTGSASAATYENLCPALSSPSFCGGAHSWAFFDAVDNSSQPSAGDVYMTTIGISGNPGVWKFGPGGEGAAFGGTNPNISGNELNFPGDTVGPVGIAVDSATGNFYVTVRENQDLEQFTSNGDPVEKGEPAENWTTPIPGEATGVAVDNSGGLSNGDIYVANESGGVIYKYKPDGTKMPEEGTVSAPYGLAVDNSGHVYTAGNGGSGPVQKFSESLAPEGTVGASEGESRAVAVDPSTGNIFIEFADGHIQEYSPAGTPIGAPITGLSGQSHGLAVSGVGSSVHRLYATNEIVGASNGLIFGQLGPQQPLTVKKAGAGQGTIAGGGINCGASCPEETTNESEGATVFLTATRATHSKFVGWTGCDEVTGEEKCKVEMTEPKTVEAEFAEIPQNTLEVEETGSGAGTLTSSPAGISCPGTCTEHFDSEGSESTVTLTAAGNERSTFTGWKGPDAEAEGCDETGATLTCEVQMTAAKTIKAEFTEITQEKLEVEDTGTGQGTVTGTSPGQEFTAIACVNNTGTCFETYNEGTTITLTAAAGNERSHFTGWKGPDAEAEGCDETGATLTCEVQMTAAKKIEAEFTKFTQEELKVETTGTGQGTVTGTSPGPDFAPISCVNNTGTCFETYNQGATIILTAASVGETSTFAGWSAVSGIPGTCTGTTSPCEVTMSGAVELEAEFTEIPQEELKVETLGLGQGTVTGTGQGTEAAPVNCSENAGTCTPKYNQGTMITLTETVGNERSHFTGWTGCDNVTVENKCEVEMTEAKTVTAEFAKFTQEELTVTKPGTGAGTVTGTKPGAEFTAIACGATCGATYNQGATITLTAAANATSKFTGWSGCDAEPAGKCEVEMSAAKAVTAGFEALPQQTLTVTKTGAGEGAVAGTAPPGFTAIACGVTCSAEYNQGATITITPIAVKGSIFAGFSGACSGTGTCEVTMSQDAEVSAEFLPLSSVKRTLTIATEGFGSGTVTSQPAGIDCSATCSHAFGQGTKVTLTANPAPGSSFTGFSGAGCSGTETTCQVLISRDTEVGANFYAPTHTLSVFDTGAGAGSVTSSPAGIDCGVGCSGVYAAGTTFTLTATPAKGSSFAGFTGCDSAAANHCAVAIGADRTVVALFNQGSGLKLARAKAHGATATLKATVAAPGSLKATGKYIKPAGAHLDAAATVPLHLKLNSAGRKALARSKRHSLEVKVKVTFTPTTGGSPVTAAKTVTFSSKGKRH